MRAGKPVYVEKPMALNYSECLDMLKVSRETGLPLFVAYYRRTLPAFLKVKELIESGAIGKVLTVELKLFKQARERHQKPEEMNWHVNPAIAGAGYFYDLASHQFDYLDFLFGPVTLIKGVAVNRAGLYPAEDTVSTLLPSPTESAAAASGALWPTKAEKPTLSTSPATRAASLSPASAMATSSLKTAKVFINSGL